MKIPFEKTIATSYRFAFHNLLSIFGIGWAPALVMFAISGGIVFLLLPGIRDLVAEGNKINVADIAAFAPQAVAALLAWILIVLIAAAMIYAGVIRKALGMLPGPVYAYFPLDTQVWRIVGAFLLVWAVWWGVVVLVGCGIAIIVNLAGNGPLAGVLSGILITLALVAGYYALIRVQFFLPVIVVAENHISLSRSWALSRGSFWRILGITLVMTIPLAVVSSTITNVLMGMYTHPLPAGATQAAVLLNSFQAIGAIAPYYILVQLLYVIGVLAFVAIAGTAAYRFVTGGDSISPPPPAKA